MRRAEPSASGLGVIRVIRGHAVPTNGVALPAFLTQLRRDLLNSPGLMPRARRHSRVK